MIPDLNPSTLEHLRTGKNLLAFSAGVDSTALFFLLKKENIPFDMAMVDYNRRAQSKEEVAYANELATRFDKKLHLKSVLLTDTNFEAQARSSRYGFFAELCRSFGYGTVITAHQLNDRTEWFFMQFVKGAGTIELLGMDYIAKEEEYTLVRPMLDISREEILAFLKQEAIPYYEDASNDDDSHTRNLFRHAITNKLVKEHRSGIQKSFHYIREDAKILLPQVPFRTIQELVLISRSDIHSDLREIDRHLKRMGYILSSAQREEIGRTKDCVIGGRLAVVLQDEMICITPYSQSVMPKAVKERFRLAGIPARIRPYLHERGISEDIFCEARKAIASSARTC